MSGMIGATSQWATILQHTATLKELKLKMHKNCWCFAVLATTIALIMSLFTGCNDANTPLDTVDVQQVFQDNRNDIQTVVEFMTELDYSNIYISDDGESMQADLKDTPINNVEVSAAMKRLLESYININKIGNTIYMLQWKGVVDIGCGIAYSINGTDNPEVQFMTELIPLTEDGWFYYVSDFNTWSRNTEKK